MARTYISMYYAYFLKSLSTDWPNWYYVGSSSDLIVRVGQHNKGEVRATRSKIPLKLVYYESYLSLTQARLREKEIKKSRWEKNKIIERLR